MVYGIPNLLTTVTALVFLFNNIPLSAIDPKKNFTQTIREEFACGNLATQQIITPIEEPLELSWLEKIKKNIQNTLLKPEVLHISDRELFETAFNTIIKNSDAATAKYEDLEKVDLINNDHSVTVFSKLFTPNTMTQAGIAWSVNTLCHPATDTDLLQQRQEIIKVLANNESLRNQLIPLFKTMSDHDRGVWRFWHTYPLIGKAFENGLYFSLPGLRKLNSSAIALEIEKYLTYAYMTCNNVLGITMPIIGQLIIGPAHTIPAAFTQCATILKNINNPLMDPTLKLLTIYLIIFSPLLCAVNLYSTHTTLHNTELGMHAIHTSLNDLAAYIAELRKLAVIINENSQLLIKMPELQNILNLFDTAKHSASFNKLLRLLSTNTFAGETSLIRMTGRVKVAYKLMKVVKDEFVEAFAIAGELESYVSIAQTMQAYTDTPTKYCFAEFMHANRPQIALVDFWNPLVDTNHVITNSITIGGNNRQNIVLTGPNTGGKTTIIKSLIINIILAQTFGIAAAKSYALTPFSKINCFMNIQDNIAAGDSLFKAEVLRAKELIAICRNTQQNNGFVFTIMDEVFTSTSPQEGEISAYQFVEKLGNFDNSIAILATHYPKMTELENNNDRFSNYHIEVLRNADNSLTRTFKLKPGPTFLNIALDILHDEGIFDL